MLKFLKWLLTLIVVPFDWLLSLFRRSSPAGAEQEQQEKSNRADALARTEGDAKSLALALDVRGAALRLVRGEKLDLSMQRPLRWWLESLSPDALKAVAAAKPDTLSRLLAGTAVQGLPAFARSEWDGSAVIESYKRDRAAALAATPADDAEMTGPQRRAAFQSAIAGMRLRGMHVAKSATPALTPTP